MIGFFSFLENLLGFTLTNERIMFIGLIGFYALLLLADWIMHKKLPWFGGILLALLGGFVIGSRFAPASIVEVIENLHAPIEDWYYLLGLAFFLLTLFAFFARAKRYKKTSSFETLAFKEVDQQVLFIINKKRNIVYFNPNIYTMLELPEQKKKAMSFIKQNVKNILIGEDEIEFKELVKVIDKKPDNENIVMEVHFIDGSKKEFSFVKNVIHHKKKSLGFAITKEFEGSQENVKSTVKHSSAGCSLTTLNLFDEPIAYYNPQKNQYALNMQMQRFLNVDHEALPADEMKQHIYGEDAKYFHNFEEGQAKRENFRMVSNKKSFWFEENILPSKDGFLSVIRRTSNINARNKLIMQTHVELLRDIEEMQAKSQHYGLLMLKFVNLLDVNNHDGRDISGVITANYFKQFLDGPYQGQVEIFQIGTLEYAILVNSLNTYEVIKRDISQGVMSLLSDTTFSIGKAIIKLEVALGLADSKTVRSDDPTAVVNAAFESLIEAEDPKYPHQYSIYTAKPVVSKDTEDVDLDDLDIDLSDDFLDQFRIDE